MKKRTTPFILCCIVAVLLLTISAGCVETGGNTDDVLLKNTLVYAGESEDTINPVLNSHSELADLICSGLMKYDANGKPIVDLAESYTYDPVAMIYTFTLKKGVTWHDDTPFTASDVVFTYEVLMHDETISSSITSDYEDIASVTAPDDHTVVFRMGDTNAAMLLHDWYPARTPAQRKGHQHGLLQPAPGRYR